MELNMTTIGNRIKERRKELRLTQLDIKEKTGISSGNMSDIERGNRLPAAATLAQLSEVLQCSVDYLLTGKSLTAENPCEYSENYTPCSPQEQKILTFFRSMSKEDQEELFMIAQMKYQKARKNLKKSSDLESGDTDMETA